jgi:hypothetical protein
MIPVLLTFLALVPLFAADSEDSILAGDLYVFGPESRELQIEPQITFSFLDVDRRCPGTPTSCKRVLEQPVDLAPESENR